MNKPKMKTLKTLTAAMSFAAITAALVTSSAASATTLSFNLTSAGYRQDSPVAADLFQSSGLMLSSGVVTACGGNCISNPIGAYTGTISGNFMGSAYQSLSFQSVTSRASISLFNESNTLVQTLNSSNNYLYSGSEGIASFVANLNYDGFYGMSYDFNVAVPVSPVPEPEAYVMLLAGLGLFGVAARRRKNLNA